MPSINKKNIVTFTVIAANKYYKKVESGSSKLYGFFVQPRLKKIFI